jgi:hypothetical protein
MRIVSCAWTRPGSEVPVKKSAYVTKVGDLNCGSGYYN